MDALITAFNATIPTFLLVLLGAFADRLFHKIDIQKLSKLAVYIFIPALMFDALAATNLSLSAALLLSLTYFIYLLVLGLMSWFGSTGLSMIERRGVLATALFGNTGNMGLPITLFAFGQAGLERAVVLFVLSIVAMFSLGPVLLSGSSEGWVRRLWDAVRLPPFWATFLGVAVNVSGLAMPVSLERSIDLLGSAAIPVMLISLGIQMRRSWVWELGGAAVRTSFFRMFIGPFVAFGVALLFGLAALDLRVLVLSAAMPAAVTMFVVAVEVKGDFAGVAKSVVMTTVLSLFAIMLVLFLLPL